MKNNKIFFSGILVGVILYYCTFYEVRSNNDFSRSKRKRVFLDRSYFDKNHKEHLIRDYFDEREQEWEVSGKNMHDKYDLMWVFSPHQIRKFSDDVMYNHLKNLEQVVEKDRMYLNFKKMDQKQIGLNSGQFLPETYLFDLGSAPNQEEIAFLEQRSNEGKWIVKPTNLFGGQGIQYFDNRGDLVDFISKSRRIQQKQRIVVQKYIEDPLLIDRKKFDVRAYLLIPSSRPYLAFLHEGFIRRALYEYNEQSKDLNIHLTNVEQQKKHPEYDKLKDNLLMSMENFYEYVEREFPQVENIKQNIQQQINEISKQIVIMMKNTIGGSHKQFQIIGVDFMLDSKFKVWLIELNKSPSWQIIHPSQEFKKQMIDNFIDLALNLSMQESPKTFYRELAQNLPDSFQLLINEFQQQKSDL